MMTTEQEAVAWQTVDYGTASFHVAGFGERSPVQVVERSTIDKQIERALGCLSYIEKVRACCCQRPAQAGA